jgi:hypothetical protein
MVPPIVPAGCDNPGVNDRVAVALAVFFAALAVVLGVRAGYREVDIDELVYRRTLVSMSHGEGYYPAMRHALVRKEGAPPTQVRSVRPPTMFLLLYRLPASSWRWVVGVVFLAVLLLAWRLGRPFGPRGGAVAVVLAGLWLLGASPLLFLHSELWGMPFALGGALAFRRRMWVAAAVLLGAAVLFRETYAVFFLAGLLWAESRRAFVLVLVALGGLAATHVVLAQQALSGHGREPAFGASGLSVRYVLSCLSPSDRVFGWAVGLTGDVLGFVGLLRSRRTDLAARLVLTAAIVLIPATIVVGRTYWGLTFGVAVACFAPSALAGMLERRRAPQG